MDPLLSLFSNFVSFGITYTPDIPYMFLLLFARFLGSEMEQATVLGPGYNGILGILSGGLDIFKRQTNRVKHGLGVYFVKNCTTCIQRICILAQDNII